MGVYSKIKRLLKALTNQADKPSVPHYNPCPECRSCMNCELHLDDCSRSLAQRDVTDLISSNASKNAKEQL